MFLVNSSVLHICVYLLVNLVRFVLEKLIDFSEIYSLQQDIAEDWVYKDAKGNYLIKYNGLTFRSVFQPILDNKNDVYGFEALIRITDENENQISPYHFFKSLEDSDLDSALAVIICSKIHLNNFSQSIHSDKKLFLNVTPSVFSILTSDQDAIKRHLERLKLLELSPEQIVWEIMEFKDSDIVNISKGIETLANYGFQVALDDYGAEHSTESRAKLLLPPIVKLDKSLLNNLMNKKTKPIRDAIKVCRSIGAKIIAEGIETKEEYDVLQAFGVDFYQGYYLGLPSSLSIKS